MANSRDPNNSVRLFGCWTSSGDINNTVRHWTCVLTYSAFSLHCCQRSTRSCSAIAFRQPECRTGLFMSPELLPACAFVHGKHFPRSMGSFRTVYGKLSHGLWEAFAWSVGSFRTDCGMLPHGLWDASAWPAGSVRTDAVSSRTHLLPDRELWCCTCTSEA